MVSSELRALTIRTSHSARGAQRTARPTFFCDWRFKSVPLRSPHGFADETYVGRQGARYGNAATKGIRL